MGLDSFFGMDDADGAMSPDKVREFQERMARNAKQMAAARKQEGKQKKKEGKLVAILLKFIRNNKKGDITLLISRCLEQNIPAVLVLAVVLLGNPEIQEEMGIQLQLTEGGGEAPQRDEEEIAGEEEPQTSMAELGEKEIENALVTLGPDTSLPLKMRIAIDLWMKSIWNAISPIPERILKTSVELDEDGQATSEPKAVLSQLAAFILRDYFAANNFKQEFENTKSFSEFLLKGLIRRLRMQVAEQKQIEGEESLRKLKKVL